MCRAVEIPIFGQAEEEEEEEESPHQTPNQKKKKINEPPWIWSSRNSIDCHHYFPFKQQRLISCALRKNNEK